MTDAVLTHSEPDIDEREEDAVIEVKDRMCRESRAMLILSKRVSSRQRRTRRSREEEAREKKWMFNVYTATASPLGG